MSDPITVLCFSTFLSGCSTRVVDLEGLSFYASHRPARREWLWVVRAYADVLCIRLAHWLWMTTSMPRWRRCPISTVHWANSSCVLFKCDGSGDSATWLKIMPDNSSFEVSAEEELPRKLEGCCGGACRIGDTEWLLRSGVLLWTSSDGARGIKAEKEWMEHDELEEKHEKDQ